MSPRSFNPELLCFEVRWGMGPMTWWIRILGKVDQNRITLFIVSQVFCFATHLSLGSGAIYQCN